MTRLSDEVSMRSLPVAFVCTIVLTFAASTIAQEKSPPLVTRGRVQLNLAGAETILAGAKKKAASMKISFNIAIVDDGGHLVAFARMDGARPASTYTALTKAMTAATFRQETGPLPAGGDPNVLLSLGLQQTAIAGGGKGTALVGGAPITVDGQVIGAVGVGGGSSGEQDLAVAKAGIAALLDAIQAKP
jgi:glc operon protein GlcG